MKKIYLVYLKIEERKWRELKYLVSYNCNFRWKNGYIIGLYAYTTKKKLLKEFLELRLPGIFIVRDMEFEDEEEAGKFHNQNYLLQIKRHRFYMDEADEGKTLTEEELEEKTMEIPTTREEYQNATNFLNENLYEFGPRVTLRMSPQVFKRSIIHALSRLDYISKWMMEYDDTFVVEGCEADLHSFGKNHLQFHNQVVGLLYLYREVFCGDEKTERCDEDE